MGSRIHLFFTGFVVFRIALLDVQVLGGAVCREIVPEGRESCRASTQQQCEKKGCCWDPRSPTFKCYYNACKNDHFGWKCKFRCNCIGQACDSQNGECQEHGCRGRTWGPGCLLESTCTYNDDSGIHYEGKVSKTKSNKECRYWQSQFRYKDSAFITGSAAASRNYCRNPQTATRATWCYTNRELDWEWCELSRCGCPLGRFGINCKYECHCHNESERCHGMSGRCQSGCHPHFQGDNCQECADGRFGPFCERTCNCQSRGDICDKTTGRCRSGCRAGWTGDDCQKECHCKKLNEICKPASGHCSSGCADGYKGHACHIAVPKLTRAPQLDHRGAAHISIKWKSWAKPPDLGEGPVSKYFVKYKMGGQDSWEMEEVEGIRNWKEFRNLQHDQDYLFRVVPYHTERFYGLPSPVLTVRTCGVPTQGPVNLKVERVQNGTKFVTLKVSWEDPDNSTWNCDRLYQYRVCHKLSIESRFRTCFPKATREAEIPMMLKYQDYTIGVSAINNAFLESDLTVLKLEGACGEISDLQSNTKTREAHLTWQGGRNPPDALKRFLLRWKQVQIADCPNTEEAWGRPVSIEPKRLTYKLSGLVPFSRYRVEVWAECDNGHSPVTRVDFRTDAADPEGRIQAVKIGRLAATSAAFRWSTPPCRLSNGRFRGYHYEAREVNTGLVAKSAQIDTTYVELTGLRPDTEYDLHVKYVNHVGSGPESNAMLFHTAEDKPTAPRDLHLISSSTTSLSVGWSPPDPPNGRITGYTVEYWSKKMIGSPKSHWLDSGPLQWTIQNLLPNTTYGIRVQAKTSAGAGAWTEQLYVYTDEGVPRRPVRFRNDSRTESSLTFRWGPPTSTNGVLKLYRVMCLLNGVDNDQRQIREVPADRYQVTVDNLLPGTWYVCEIRAATGKGYGDTESLIAYTAPSKPEPPPAPKVKESESTDSSVMITVNPSDLHTKQRSYTDKDGFYQIVVERMGNVDKSAGDEARVRRSTGPCKQPHQVLTNYSVAKELGHRCYITAQLLPAELRQMQDTFTVGDGKKYGSFYNAPLEKGQEYGLWFGVVKETDGVTAAAYSKSAVTVVASKYEAEPLEQEGDGMMAASIGLAAVFIVLLVVIAVGAFILIRRRKSQRSPAEMEEKRETEEYMIAQKVIMNTNTTKEEDMDEGLGPNLFLSDEPSETDPLYTEIQTPIVVGRPIKVEDLWDYVKEHKKNYNDGFREEYEELPQGLIHSCDVARKPENKYKNRYGNIIAYDHSRIVLEPYDDDPHSDYINANYMDAYRKRNDYVATQGPNKHTLRDIWRMAWQLNSQRIVMVTNLLEDGRHKCEQYWPEKRKGKYGDIEVTHESTEQLADFTIRTFKLVKNGECKIVRQFHFTSWPDHGIPAYTMSFLAFRKKVRSYDNPDAGPTIIHCSAGVGRTGTFIAMDCLLDQAREEGQVDVLSCACAMRENRVNMIQTQEQYLFVYDALLEALKCGDTSIPCVDFRIKYLELAQVNPNSGRTKLEDEYELLTVMSPEIRDSCQDALHPENRSRNRHTDIVPMDNLSRPYLVTHIHGATDYINAVYIDGYRQRDAYIVTQMPLPSTVVDFWSLLHDHECKTVIMMNEMDTSDPTCAQYWPEALGRYQYGPFDISLLSEDNTMPDLVIRDFTIHFSKKGEEPQMVRQFQYTGWPRDRDLPRNNSTLISLLGHVERWQQRSGNRSIVVHCMDGASRSGLLCTISYIIERLKLEQDIDIFQTVKQIRTNRPQIIANMDQYQYLYDMAGEYMDCFETYANFK